MCDARRILLRREARDESSARNSVSCQSLAILRSYGTRNRYKCVPTSTVALPCLHLACHCSGCGYVRQVVVNANNILYFRGTYGSIGNAASIFSDKKLSRVSSTAYLSIKLSVTFKVRSMHIQQN